MSEKNTIKYLRIATLLAFLTTILASVKLWHSDRSLPPVPVHESFPSLPLWLNYILLAGIVIIIIISLFKEKPTGLLIALIPLTVVLVLFDLNRLLPPTYLFICFYFILVLFYTKVISYKTLSTIVRIIVIGIYLSAGYCKLNEGFDAVIYQPIISPLKSILDETIFEIIKQGHLIVPLTELFIAVGLLIPRIRNIALFFVCVTHAAVMFAVPALLNINLFVVYPWNILMVVLAFMFFYKAEKFSISCLIDALKNHFVKLFVVLYIVVPFVHLFGYFDTYISYEMWSGKREYAFLLFPEKVYNKLPPDIKAVTRPENVQGNYGIYLDEWIYADVKSSLYSERRTIKFYKNYIMKITDSKDKEVYLLVRQNGVDTIIYD